MLGFDQHRFHGTFLARIRTADASVQFGKAFLHLNKGLMLFYLRSRAARDQLNGRDEREGKKCRSRSPRRSRPSRRFPLPNLYRQFNESRFYKVNKVRVVLAPYMRSYGGTRKKEAMRPNRKSVVCTKVCLPKIT